MYIDWAGMTSERSIEIPWMIDQVAKKSPTSILDIGFAGGFYQQELLDMGVTYTGVDFDLSRITGESLQIGPDKKRVWSDLIQRFECIQDDIVNSTTTLLSRRFDMVMSISTIEHIVPAGYASNYTDLTADLVAVNNMKKMSDNVLLTFPVGRETFFYNPSKNKNARILCKLMNFRQGKDDHMFYDSARIAKLVGDWDIVEKLFYIENKVGKWEQSTEDVACAVIHNTSSPTTVCLMHIQKSNKV